MKNQFPSNPRSRGAASSQVLQNQLRALIRFMVHRPQESAQSPLTAASDRYSAKARFYPYLPSKEEQRDWLDRLYSL